MAVSLARVCVKYLRYNKLSDWVLVVVECRVIMRIRSVPIIVDNVQNGATVLIIIIVPSF
jgi:hypothetical protein